MAEISGNTASLSPDELRLQPDQPSGRSRRCFAMARFKTKRYASAASSPHISRSSSKAPCPSSPSSCSPLACSSAVNP